MFLRAPSEWHKRSALLMGALLRCYYKSLTTAFSCTVFPVPTFVPPPPESKPGMIRCPRYRVAMLFDPPQRDDFIVMPGQRVLNGLNVFCQSGDMSLHDTLLFRH